MGFCVFNLPVSLAMTEIIYTLFHYHHQIGSLGLGHETGVCDVCLSIFLYIRIVDTLAGNRWYQDSRAPYSTRKESFCVMIDNIPISWPIGYVLWNSHRTWQFKIDHVLFFWSFRFNGFRCLNARYLGSMNETFCWHLPRCIVTEPYTPDVITSVTWHA